MFPFAAVPGTFSGMRPTLQQPDGPLGEDDRTGLRVLYANPADTLHGGSIRGQIFPANPLALPASPPGVTGVFGTAGCRRGCGERRCRGATIGGWSFRGWAPRSLTALTDRWTRCRRRFLQTVLCRSAEWRGGTIADQQWDRYALPECHNRSGCHRCRDALWPAVNTSFTNADATGTLRWSCPRSDIPRLVLEILPDQVVG